MTPVDKNMRRTTNTKKYHQSRCAKNVEPQEIPDNNAEAALQVVLRKRCSEIIQKIYKRTPIFGMGVLL